MDIRTLISQIVSCMVLEVPTVPAFPMPLPTSRCLVCFLFVLTFSALKSTQSRLDCVDMQESNILSNRQIVKSSSRQVVKSSSRQDVKSSSRQIVKSYSCCLVFSFLRFFVSSSFRLLVISSSRLPVLGFSTVRVGTRRFCRTWADIGKREDQRLE